MTQQATTNQKQTRKQQQQDSEPQAPANDVDLNTSANPAKRPGPHKSFAAGSVTLPLWMNSTEKGDILKPGSPTRFYTDGEGAKHFTTNLRAGDCKHAATVYAKAADYIEGWKAQQAASQTQSDDRPPAEPSQGEQK